MKKFSLPALLIALVSCTSLHAQAEPPASDWRKQYQHDGLTELNARLSNPNVQDGNGTLGTIFDTTLCGLNYSQSTVRLGQRLNPIGAAQPANFSISGIPSCAPIVRAYFWCVVMGTGVPITANITNPDGVSASFNMTVVGQGADLCWGATGTYVYRADVTSIVSSNGNYVISGIPVTTQLTPNNNDADGATLLIMYQDMSATYTGSMHINDGAVNILGGNSTVNMTGFTSCGNSTSANGFMGLADLQMNGSTYSMNGSPTTTYNTFNWMDFISQNTTVTNGQSSSTFNFGSGGDCYCLFLAGLYWQTSCMTCTPASNGLSVTASNITTATCPGNGAATVNVTGGSGNYIITWNTNPQQTGNSASGLNGGSYVVTVLDTVADMCGSLLVTIPYTGPFVTTSATPVNCQVNGSATAQVTGGTSPYTYQWSPSGGNASTAANLSAGTYTVTVTDGSGCSVSATAVIGNSATLNVAVNISPDSCPSPSGTATCSVSGGQMPYTFLWSPGNQTSPAIANQPAGNYTVTVTDGLGCVISTVVNIPSLNNVTQVNVSAAPPAYCGNGFMLYAGVNISPSTISWQPTTYLSNPNSASPMCIPYSNITYTVTATSQCGTGTDTVSVSMAGVNLMDEPVCVVSVDTAVNRNVIVWQHSSSSTFGHYNIYRETVSAGVYSLIGTQHASVYTTFTDMTSNPMNSAERYRISYVDSCGFESDTSLHHRTLFLQVGPAVPQGYNLVWTAYEGLNIGTYNIYRGANAGNLLLIAQVPGNTFNYSDPNPPMGNVIYMVEAVHPNGGCFPSINLAGGPNVQSVPNGSLSNLQVAFVGMNENSPVQSSLTVSPNPGNGAFVLTCNTSAGEMVNVTVTDALGQTVFVKSDASGGSQMIMVLDLSSLATGMYNVLVTNGADKGVAKLVITQ